MRQAIQQYKQNEVISRNNVLATPNPTWCVAEDVSCQVQRQQRQQEVIKINQFNNVQQQKGTNTMKNSNILIVILIAGALLGFGMFYTANHAIFATPHIQQTAQVQAEWAGRVAIAQAESPFHTALQMFNGAATFGFVLLGLVVLGGAALVFSNRTE